ncbi:MAG: GFA family protein [Polyangiales bacterium]|nr:GFA family protein [Sandaracinaceae bacterium]
MTEIRTGGCQCGAIRYAVDGPLGRASICHCRMCQKAFGNAFAPLVTAKGFRLTRGALRHFQSSNKVRRGFCADCGTPLTYEPLGYSVEVAIATLDDPRDVAPVLQVGLESRLPWCDGLSALPTRSAEEQRAVDAFFRDIASNQHPDGDV